MFIVCEKCKVIQKRKVQSSPKKKKKYKIFLAVWLDFDFWLDLDFDDPN